MKRSTPAEILIVDDVPENLSLLSDLLSMQGYHIHVAWDGKEALRIAQSTPLDLILLDVSMPEMDGFTACSKLKTWEITQHIPVIFLSALDRPIDKVRAFEVGGADYVTKPFQMPEVLKRIQHQLSLSAAMAKIQQMHDSVEELVQERTAHLKAEIQEHRQTQQQLLHLISHDPLTNLPNRSVAINQLGKALEQVWHNSAQSFAVLYLDCDRFKVVNDSLGFSSGDQLLIAMVERIQEHLSPRDFLARMGGDEFMLLRQGVQDLTAMTQLAQQIQTALKIPFQLHHHQLHLQTSIGIVLGTSHYQDVDALLRGTDTAISHAKLIGGGCYKVFEGDGQYQPLELGLPRVVDDRKTNLI
jgi:diguanylate cyclase (GGDEF)-like protein